MNNYRVERGEIDHLSTDDLSELVACMMTLKVHDTQEASDIVFILKACLIESVETPWHVIHDEDLITLHRNDDNLPVLLFKKKAST